MENTEPERAYLEGPTEVLKTLADLVGTLADEFLIEFRGHELRIQIVDPSHVAMLEVLIPSGGLISFTGSGQEFLLGAGKLLDILKLGTKSGTTKITENGEQCVVVEQGRMSRAMRTGDPSGITRPKFPSLSLPALFEVAASELVDICKGVGLLTDYVLISALTDGVTLSAKGELDQVRYDITRDQLAKMELDIDAHALYSLDYFELMVKAIKKALGKRDNLIFEYGTNYPAQLSFEFSGLACRFLLAPRIENDGCAYTECDIPKLWVDIGDKPAGELAKAAHVVEEDENRYGEDIPDTESPEDDDRPGPDIEPDEHEPPTPPTHDEGMMYAHSRQEEYLPPPPRD